VLPLGTLSYRINSGAYTAYSSPFSLSSGQTLGWRYQSSGDEFSFVNVTDDARTALINSFFVSKFSDFGGGGIIP
jgi:hypothetical protein